MKAHYYSRSLLTSRLGLLYTKAFTVSLEDSFTSPDFQHLTFNLDFCAPKNGNKGLIQKTIAQLNSYRDACYLSC